MAISQIFKAIAPWDVDRLTVDQLLFAVNAVDENNKQAKA
jgi:hypothetical protein